MRSLSAGMLNAQTYQPLWSPYNNLWKPLIKVTISNNRCSTRHLAWAGVHSYANPEGPCVAVMPADGSLVRFRIDVANNKIYRSRVVDPDAESDYDNWVDTGDEGMAIAACALGTHVAYFFIEDIGFTDIRWARSNDSGASFGADADTGLDSDVNGHLAAFEKASDEICLIWTRGEQLYASKWNGAAWSAENASGITMTACHGIALDYYGDWDLIVCGEDGSNIDGVWISMWGDGFNKALGTWMPLLGYVTRDRSEGYRFRYPSLNYSAGCRLFFSEHYEDPTARIQVFWSFHQDESIFQYDLWHEPIPFNSGEYYGLSLVNTSVNVFLCSHDVVWYADSTFIEWDITTDVVQIRQTIDPERETSKLVIVLDNTAGTYNGFDKLGYEIYISLGYKLDTGPEYSQAPDFWITGWKFVSPPWHALRAFWPQGVLGTLAIEAESSWDLLKRWKPRKTIEWEHGDETLGNILQFVLARSGITLYPTGSDTELGNYKPNFKITRGRNGRWIVKKLLELCFSKSVLRYGNFRTIVPADDDTEVYTYHSTYGQATVLYRGHYGEGLQDPNFVQVIGDSIMEEGFEWSQLGAVYDRYLPITKPEYVSSARAASRVAIALRQTEITERNFGWITTPINTALEEYDVIKVTDIAGGITNQLYRVLAIITYYNARSWSFSQKLKIGKV